MEPNDQDLLLIIKRLRQQVEESITKSESEMEAYNTFVLSHETEYKELIPKIREVVAVMLADFIMADLNLIKHREELLDLVYACMGFGYMMGRNYTEVPDIFRSS